MKFVCAGKSISATFGVLSLPSLVVLSGSGLKLTMIEDTATSTIIEGAVKKPAIIEGASAMTGMKKPQLHSLEMSNGAKPKPQAKVQDRFERRIMHQIDKGKLGAVVRKSTRLPRRSLLSKGYECTLTNPGKSKFSVFVDPRQQTNPCATIGSVFENLDMVPVQEHSRIPPQMLKEFKQPGGKKLVKCEHTKPVKHDVAGTKKLIWYKVTQGEWSHDVCYTSTYINMGDTMRRSLDSVASKIR